MEVMSSSKLNPNAPMFVPWAYRAVEDFSDEWWELVQSTGWFRDYWLQECFQDPQMEEDYLDFNLSDVEPVLPEIESLFDGYYNNQGEKDSITIQRDLVTLGGLKWRSERGVAVAPLRYAEKTPKIVNVKVCPRNIQQPR